MVTRNLKYIWQVRQLLLQVPLPARSFPRRRYCNHATERNCHQYGDNVDTDVIIPARYLNTIDKKELASHCMEDLDTTFTSA